MEDNLQQWLRVLNLIPVTEQQVHSQEIYNPPRILTKKAIKVVLTLEKSEKNNNHDVDEAEALILQKRSILLSSMQELPRTCQTVLADTARCH